MDGPLAPCLRCGTEVPAGASICRGCGYDVGTHERARWWLGVVGMATTLTVVLAPVGLPLLWLASRHHLAGAGTVTRRAEASLVEHVLTVLRCHVGLGGEPGRHPLLEAGPGRAHRDVHHRPR